jgi:DNA-binding CsgD family transcriptional regulator
LYSSNHPDCQREERDAPARGKKALECKYTARRRPLTLREILAAGAEFFGTIAMAETKNLVETLTAREIEVLRLIATGCSTKEIAESLGIAFKTAACHRSRIMAKLGIHEIANLTRYAIRTGLVDAGGGGPGRERQNELFARLRAAEARYQQAMEAYGSFLQERDSIGLANPDSSTGMRRLRQSERLAHEEYHTALVALREYLLGK